MSDDCRPSKTFFTHFIFGNSRHRKLAAQPASKFSANQLGFCWPLARAALLTARFGASFQSPFTHILYVSTAKSQFSDWTILFERDFGPPCLIGSFFCLFHRDFGPPYILVSLDVLRMKKSWSKRHVCWCRGVCRCRGSIKKCGYSHKTPRSYKARRSHQDASTDPGNPYAIPNYESAFLDRSPTPTHTPTPTHMPLRP